MFPSTIYVVYYNRYFTCVMVRLRPAAQFAFLSTDTYEVVPDSIGYLTIGTVPKDFSGLPFLDEISVFIEILAISGTVNSVLRIERAAIRTYLIRLRSSHGHVANRVASSNAHAFRMKGDRALSYSSLSRDLPVKETARQKISNSLRLILSAPPSHVRYYAGAPIRSQTRICRVEAGRSIQLSYRRDLLV